MHSKIQTLHSLTKNYKIQMISQTSILKHIHRNILIYKKRENGQTFHIPVDVLYRSADNFISISGIPLFFCKIHHYISQRNNWSVTLKPLSRFPIHHNTHTQIKQVLLYVLTKGLKLNHFFFHIVFFID